MYRYVLLYLFFAHILLTFSYLPIIMRWQNTPANQTYMGNRINDQYDYNQYLSVIKQGRDGAWFYEDPYTGEPTKPGYFLIFYIFVGKVASLFHLSQPIAYLFAHLIAVELFFCALFLLVNAFLTRHAAFVAGIVALFGGISPMWLYAESEAFVRYIPWWYSVNPFRRLDAPAHHLFGQALLLLGIYYLIRVIKEHHRNHMILTLICTFVAGIVFTPAVFPFVFALPLAFLFAKDKTRHLFLMMIATSIAGILSLLTAWIQSQQGHPWDLWQRWEVAQWNSNPAVNKAFFLSFGILPLLSLLAIVWMFFRKRNWNYMILCFWALLPFFLLPLASFLGIGKIRLMGAAPFVPFSILFAMTVFLVFPKSLWWKIGCLFLFLVTTVPVNYSFFKHSIEYVRNEPFKHEIYIKTDVWELVTRMDRVLPKNTLILSEQVMGNIIPAYTQAKTYVGHPVLTIDYHEKIAHSWKFFAGEFTSEEAYAFLKQHNIAYVYFGWQEYMRLQRSLSYPFLQPFLQSGETILYRVE